MPKAIPLKFRLVYFLIFALVFLVGFPILVFYSAGYTIDGTTGLSIRGGVYVFTPEPNTSVFVGNELKNKSGFFQRNVLVDGLKPDRYLVLVANDDFWPWAKLIDVNSGEVESLFPLFVPKVIKAVEVEGVSSEYDEIAALFKKSPASKNIPSAASSAAYSSASEIASERASTTFATITRKRVKVWLDGASVFAKWQGHEDAAPKYFCGGDGCLKPILVFQSSIPIQSFDFYPLRDDAIILALDNGIYAVEIDRRKYQNFYPIYRGQAPDFRVDSDKVYVKDNDYIAVLDLQQ